MGREDAVGETRMKWAGQAGGHNPPACQEEEEDLVYPGARQPRWVRIFAENRPRLAGSLSVGFVSIPAVS